MMLILACAVAAPVAAQQTTSPVAFVNVTVIPMDRERALPGHVVVVQGGRISAMGPVGRIEVPADATLIDGRGKFLMPGLAEMHAHIPPGNPPDTTIQRVLSLFALNGVTTIRGMLGSPVHLGWRDRAAKREILSPRIWTTGPSFNNNTTPTPDSAIKRVTDQKQAGYDLLKIHPGVPRDAFDSLAATAQRLGIRFAGHVPAAVGLARAIEARYSTIDHLDGYLEALAPAGAQSSFFGLSLMDQVDSSKLAGLVAATKAAGIAMVPTMAFFEAVAGDEPVEALTARPGMRYVYQGMITNWTNQTNNTRAATPAEARQRFLALRRRILWELHQGGVPILLGSDAPQFWNPPGFSLVRELQVYVAAGLTPYQALATGTRNVAEHLGNLAEAGTVEAGKHADLILLDANPLTDVGNLARKAGVMLGGRWLPRAEIDRRLALLERH